MHPSERVRFAVQTAKAVLEDRLDPAEATAAMELQIEQLLPQLRSDRDMVTRSESESVATTLRLLGEQINDREGSRDDPESHAELARMLGQMAQALR